MALPSTYEDSQNRTTKVSLAVAASAGLFVVGTASGAVGAKLITGDDIAAKSITSANLAPESVGKGKLKPGLLASIESATSTGTTGTPGAPGPAGPKGAEG